MFDVTPLFLVETPDALADAAERLSHADVIGVDTESDSFYHYQEKVCLLQLSDLHADYIIDPLKVPDLSPLAPIFANRGVVKIFHGADYDVVSLKRDFHFEIRNLFDTLVAAQLIGMPRFGLADLIERYFGITLDKQYQRHDWASRPLLEEHLDYARGDTHWLLALRELLIKRVHHVGRSPHLEEECRLLENRVWAGKGFDPEGWVRIKGGNALDDTGKRILRRLWAWRDEEARRADRPQFKVINDDVLLAVAEARPRSDLDLDRLFTSKSAMKRRYGRGLLRAVTEGLADTNALPKAAPKPRSGPKTRLNGRLAERALGELKNWRNALISGNSRLSPFTVVSNSVLKSIAHARPYNLEELATVPDIRSWQVKEYGDDLLDVLDRVDPQ